MQLNDILKIAIKSRASDIHIKAGLPPMFRIDGALVPLSEAERFTPEMIVNMSNNILSAPQKQVFLQKNEVDLAYGVPGLGRFRVNVFQQRGTIGMVLRMIPFSIPSFEELHLPAVLKTVAAERRGLILVTGTTGSGKSTTLASIINHINQIRTAHIITIEDPIEFLIKDKLSIINQREIGIDTGSFALALRAALRQDPDVILVGEMRDLETIETALLAAETGHLVLSTLHTVDATETINRITSVFPPHQQDQIRLQLASILKTVISQRLVPRADKKGRVPALEIMRNTAHVRDLISAPERLKEIHEAITQGYHSYGMQTFDQSLMQLYKNKLITYEEALRQSSNPDDFALQASGVTSSSNKAWESFTQEKPAEENLKSLILNNQNARTGSD